MCHFIRVLLPYLTLLFMKLIKDVDYFAIRTDTRLITNLLKIHCRINEQFHYFRTVYFNNIPSETRVF
jgi:hypothetical protein